MDKYTTGDCSSRNNFQLSIILITLGTYEDTENIDFAFEWPSFYQQG